MRSDQSILIIMMCLLMGRNSIQCNYCMQALVLVYDVINQAFHTVHTVGWGSESPILVCDLLSMLSMVPAMTPFPRQTHPLGAVRSSQ